MARLFRTVFWATFWGRVAAGIPVYIIVGIFAAICLALGLGGPDEWVSRVIPDLALWVTRFGLVTLGLLAIVAIIVVWRRTKPPLTAQKPTAKSNLPDKLPELGELFKSDFKEGKGGLRAIIDYGSKVDVVTGEKKETTEILYKIIKDFGSGAEFLSVYIPKSPHVIGLCELVIKEHKKWLTSDPLGLEIGGGGVTSPLVEKDLVFTGKVYVYHENSLTLTELGKLEDLYRTNGLKPQFRGSGYALAVSSAKKR